MMGKDQVNFGSFLPPSCLNSRGCACLELLQWQPMDCTPLYHHQPEKACDLCSNLPVRIGWIALLMAGISWQPCCSSSEGYLVLRSEQQICSQRSFGMQKDPEAPREKLICLHGSGVGRTYWVDGTTLGCAQVTCPGLSLLRVSKNPSPAVLGGLLS